MDMVLTFKAREEEEEEEEELAKFIPAPGAVIETKLQGASYFWNRGCVRLRVVFRNLRRTLSTALPRQPDAPLRPLLVKFSAVGVSCRLWPQGEEIGQNWRTVIDRVPNFIYCRLEFPYVVAFMGAKRR